MKDYLCPQCKTLIINGVQDWIHGNIAFSRRNVPMKACPKHGPIAPILAVSIWMWLITLEDESGELVLAKHFFPYEAGEKNVPLEYVEYREAKEAFFKWIKKREKRLPTCFVLQFPINDPKWSISCSVQGCPDDCPLEFCPAFIESNQEQFAGLFAGEPVRVTENTLSTETAFGEA